MKFKLMIAGLAVSVMPVINLYSEQTNELFYPEDAPRITYQNGSEYVALNQQTRDAAVKAGECFPSDQDPNGHWGSSAYGFQLSVRAETNVFVAGGTMRVAVILRNTTTNDMTVAIMDGLEDKFRIVDADGRVCPENRLLPGGSGQFHCLPARRQIKTTVDLAQRVALKPGIYTIMAQQSVFDGAKGLKSVNNITNLSSGAMNIVIVPAK